MVEALFTFAFLQRALLAGLAVGLLAPTVGTFFVARRQSFFADTLAHASLAGVALGFVFGMSSLWAAMMSAVMAALVMERLRSKGQLSGDAALALVLSGSLAIAVVVMGLVKKFNTQLLSYLFGSITAVTWMDVAVMYGIGFVALLIIFLFYKEFFLITFDDRLAKAQGIPVVIYEMLFAALAAVVVAVGMRVVGALLVSALMVIPVLAAERWGKGFVATLGIAVINAVIAIMVGLWLSFVADLAAGATIVLVALGLYIGSVLFSFAKKSR